MFSRISNAGLVALVAGGALAGCGAEPSGAPQGSDVDCAIGPGADYSTACTLEQAADEGGAFFLIHHPDGGFRRVKYDAATGDLAAMDGADTLQDRSLNPGKVREFAIGEDRYLIPAEMLVSAPE